MFIMKKSNKLNKETKEDETQQEVNNTKFTETANLVFQHARKLGHVEKESVYHFPEQYNFSGRDFTAFFEVVLFYAIEKQLYKFNVPPFPKYEIKVEHESHVYLFTATLEQEVVHSIHFLGSVSENEYYFNLEELECLL